MTQQPEHNNRVESRTLVIAGIIAIAATVLGITKCAPSKEFATISSPSLTDEEKREIEDTRQGLIRIFSILREIEPEPKPEEKPENHTVTELLTFPNGKVDEIGTIRDCVEQTGTFTCSGSDFGIRCISDRRAISVNLFPFNGAIEIGGIGEDLIVYPVEDDFTDEDYINTLELACRDTVASLLSAPPRDTEICDYTGECWNAAKLEDEVRLAGKKIDSSTEIFAKTLQDYGYQTSDMGSNMLTIETEDGSLQLHGLPIVDRIYDDETKLIGAHPVSVIIFMTGCLQGETDDIIGELTILTDNIGHFYDGNSRCYGEDYSSLREGDF